MSTLYTTNIIAYTYVNTNNIIITISHEHRHSSKCFVVIINFSNMPSTKLSFKLHSNCFPINVDVNT